VALAWWKLYGFPWDPRLWFAFFLHDIGYFGKPNMDGVEGKQHPFLGAKIMHFLFDWRWNSCVWYNMSLYHSRDLARLYFAQPSKLCWADKLAFAMYPVWLLKLLYGLTGEAAFYIDNDWAKANIPEPRTFDTWYPVVYEDNLKGIRRANPQWK
jgi:hypothetical protein